MITEWFMRLGAFLVDALMGALPDLDPPSWIGGGASSVATVMSNARSLGAWVPIEIFAVVVGAVLACLVVGVGIKVTRIVASFLTVGGGSAG